MHKCMCQKSETRFFSRMCQDANAMFIVLFRSFLAGLELNLHRHAFAKKRLNYALSYDFEIFKRMSHNLELLSFQKMCGLFGFIRKMKALQRSARGRSWRVADTLRRRQSSLNQDMNGRYFRSSRHFFVIQSGCKLLRALFMFRSVAVNLV